MRRSVTTFPRVSIWHVYGIIWEKQRLQHVTNRGVFYKPNCNVTNMEKVKDIIHAESIKEGRQNLTQAVLTGVDSSS